MGGKRKKPGNVGLSSPQVEGQGTTSTEIDGKSMSSSRKSTKKN
ncbi:YuzL family protein [Sutcliffiella horikoshii]|nr:YuzL family protein [Sutcliffiella horikoshii]MCG1023152.1 YuzL family protein [Sutcliffiella horikoshii]